MVLLQIFLLQIVTCLVIIFVLGALLKRELIKSALQAIEQIEPRHGILEVTVVTAVALNSSDDVRLRSAIAEKFHPETVNISLDAALKGGMVIKAGGLLLDYSLLTRIKHLFGSGNE
jgi:F0F1-type ATP synthase delta subunit